MSLKLNPECVLCHMQRSLDTACKLGDEETAMAFAKELMQYMLQLPEDASSPTVGPGTTALFTKYYGLSQDRYKEEKEESNRFVLSRMDSIRQRVAQAEDPLYAALQFAILGNYIDFSALRGQVSFAQLDAMLDQAADMHVDAAVYEQLKEDLAKGKDLLYLTDNAGEICFDRIFGEEIQKHYPHLAITFCVRGGPAHNDATREDAKLAGIPFPVIDNGNTVGGTEMRLRSEELKQAMDKADVIIAKGMGNIETLYGSGFNIYYAFLIKCSRFVSLFQKPMFTPMLLRERKD